MNRILISSSSLKEVVLLSNKDHDAIAVINASASMDVTKTIENAISEHFCADSVTILESKMLGVSENKLTFKAEIKLEDSDEAYNDNFTLQIVASYSC